MQRINVRMLWATCAAMGFVAASTMIALDLTASGSSAFYDQASGEVDLVWTSIVFVGWFASSFAGCSALVFTVARLRGLGTERRKRPVRVKLAIKVDLEGDPTASTGLTQDISEGGLFVVTNRARPVGDRMRLQFQLPGSTRALSVETEVRWIREPPSPHAEAVGGMGLRFVNLSREDAATIRAFLARRVAGENPQK
jgi:uncharacterized protein (TIGR02266 family)